MTVPDGASREDWGLAGSATAMKATIRSGTRTSNKFLIVHARPFSWLTSRNEELKGCKAFPTIIRFS
jgi:hypothetical protein